MTKTPNPHKVDDYYLELSIAAAATHLDECKARHGETNPRTINAQKAYVNLLRESRRRSQNRRHEAGKVNL